MPSSILSSWITKTKVPVGLKHYSQNTPSVISPCKSTYTGPAAVLKQIRLLLLSAPPDKRNVTLRYIAFQSTGVNALVARASPEHCRQYFGTQGSAIFWFQQLNR